MSPTQRQEPTAVADFRRRAIDAITQWHQMGLSQKPLAIAANVSESYLSHMKNDNDRGTPEVYHRIIEAVAAERRRRLAFPMRVIAFCHDQQFDSSSVSDEAIVASVKATLSSADAAPCALPEHINGVLLTIGAPSSNLYLIAIGSLTSDDKKRAVAHELEHLRDLILKDLRRPPPPSSSF
jgi:transcriptional regulator with XRE-family HTH domain